MSFKYVVTFSMDEYVGIEKCPPPRRLIGGNLAGLTGRRIGRSHPQSYHHYMFEHFYRHIDISPPNVNVLDGNAVDLDAECAADWPGDG